MWLGPAPKRPFNIRRFHGNWRWFFDYGTGDLGNDGGHTRRYFPPPCLRASVVGFCLSPDLPITRLIRVIRVIRGQVFALLER